MIFKNDGTLLDSRKLPVWTNLRNILLSSGSTLFAYVEYYDSSFTYIVKYALGSTVEAWYKQEGQNYPGGSKSKRSMIFGEDDSIIYYIYVYDYSIFIPLMRINANTGAAIWTYALTPINN